MALTVSRTDQRSIFKTNLCHLTVSANSEGTKLNLTAVTRYKAQKHKHVLRDLRTAVVSHSKPRPWMITDDSKESSAFMFKVDLATSVPGNSPSQLYILTERNPREKFLIYDIFINCSWVVTRWQYTFTHKQ